MPFFKEALEELKFSKNSKLASGMRSLMRKYDHSVNKRNVDDFYNLMEEQETFLQVFGSFFPSFDNNEQ